MANSFYDFLLENLSYTDAKKIFNFNDDNFNVADIKKKYRSLSVIHHPDKTGGSEEKMKDINSARDILFDYIKNKSSTLTGVHAHANTSNAKSNDSSAKKQSATGNNCNSNDADINKIYSLISDKFKSRPLISRVQKAIRECINNCSNKDSQKAIREKIDICANQIYDLLSVCAWDVLSQNTKDNGVYSQIAKTIKNYTDDIRTVLKSCDNWNKCERLLTALTMFVSAGIEIDWNKNC